MVFFPRGPLVPGGLQDEELVSLLAKGSPAATWVCVNYRCHERYRFPIAIHDTLAAYDWIVENLTVPSSSLAASSEPRYRYTPPTSRIAVCGELVGGGLATMLALTECQMGRPSVVAAAVNCPTLDWTFGLDGPAPDSPSENVVDEEGGPPPSSRPKGRPAKMRLPSSWSRYSSHPRLSATDMSNTRQRCFDKPASYFDPFASPLLFFRTAGVELPTEDPSSRHNGYAQIPIVDPIPTVPPPRRTAHRRYPPTGMGLRLPRMRISVGTENILHDQGSELAGLMRRSIVSNDSGTQERLMDENDAELRPNTNMVDAVRLDAERRIQLVCRQGLGLWCNSDQIDSSSSDVVDVGRWLRQALDDA